MHLLYVIAMLLHSDTISQDERAVNIGKQNIRYLSWKSRKSNKFRRMIFVHHNGQ